MYMIEINPRKEWIGKNLKEIGIRKTMNLNVVAIKQVGGHWSFVDPDIPFREDNVLLIVVEKKDMKKIQ